MLSFTQDHEVSWLDTAPIFSCGSASEDDSSGSGDGGGAVRADAGGTGRSKKGEGADLRGPSSYLNSQGDLVLAGDENVDSQNGGAHSLGARRTGSWGTRR